MAYVDIEQDNTEAVLGALQSQVVRGMETIGLAAEGHAKMETPVVTGTLRNSITHVTVPAERAVYVGTNVEYAVYVERGRCSKHQMSQGHRMLEHAATQHAGEYRQIMKSALGG